jgi:hypothetical protein
MVLSAAVGDAVVTSCWIRVAPVVLLAGCGRTLTYEGVVHPACKTGNVTGRICAPDKTTWLNGATVLIDAIDCNGRPVTLSTASGDDGTFELDGVPEGEWTVQTSLGSFMQSTKAFVTAGTTQHISDGALCIAQQNVSIAVVSGAGDKIENLLASLGLKYTLFLGTSSSWSGDAALFLNDLSWMQRFDLIFVDCAAASAGNYQVDFGEHASSIESNLHAYVAGGGSLYASDWGLLFAAYAAPGAFTAAGVEMIGSPLDATKLMGFAPQTVSAVIEDQGLEVFLGKPRIDIAFPRMGSAVSLHWGLLLQATGARVLALADFVEVCGDPMCSTAGSTLVDSVPLAVTLKLTPADQRGGRVVYTSFHNIAQSGDDVAKMLKYLVLNL